MLGVLPHHPPCAHLWPQPTTTPTHNREKVSKKTRESWSVQPPRFSFFVNGLIFHPVIKYPAIITPSSSSLPLSGGGTKSGAKRVFSFFQFVKKKVSTHFFVAWGEKLRLVVKIKISEQRFLGLFITLSFISLEKPFIVFNCDCRRFLEPFSFLFLLFFFFVGFIIFLQMPTHSKLHSL